MPYSKPPLIEPGSSPFQKPGAGRLVATVKVPAVIGVKAPPAAVVDACPAAVVVVVLGGTELLSLPHAAATTTEHRARTIASFLICALLGALTSANVAPQPGTDGTLDR